MATKLMKTLQFSGDEDIYKVYDDGALRTEAQTLTEEQKAQVIANLGIETGDGSEPITLLENGDLNDYKTPNTQFFIPASASANVLNKYWTSEVDLWIRVSALAPDNSFILQQGFMLQNRRVMTRYYNASTDTWSSWCYLHNSAYVIPVGMGGTGASSAANARTKLEITPANIGAAEATHTHSDYLPTSKVIYSSSQPTGVSGAIWLKPKS